MEIIWSTRSLVRLEEVAEFISQDSPARAFEFIEKLRASINRLIDFPLSGPVVVENPAYRQLVFEGYRIIYHVTPKRIEIFTIVSPGLPHSSAKVLKEKGKKK